MEFLLFGKDITETYDQMDPFEVVQDYSVKHNFDANSKVRVLRNGSFVEGTIKKEYYYHTRPSSTPDSWKTVANNYAASYKAAAEAGNPIPTFDPSLCSNLITTSITGANPNHGEGNNPGWTDHWTEYNTTYPFQMQILHIVQKKPEDLMLKFKKMEAQFFYQKSHLVV